MASVSFVDGVGLLDNSIGRATTSPAWLPILSWILYWRMIPRLPRTSGRETIAISKEIL